MQTLSLPVGALNQEDVDWLSHMGCIQRVAAGSILVQAGQSLQDIYWILDGVLTTIVTNSAGVEQQIAQLQPGQQVGWLSFIHDRPAVTHTIATTPVQVLAVTHPKLRSKLRQDAGFASRFYQTSSAFLSQEVRGISSLLLRGQATAEQPLRKVLLVFAELDDSDVDWIASVGEIQPLAAGSQLIQQGSSLDAIYILLEGTLAVLVSAMVDGVSVSKQVAQLAIGEMLGEMSFVDAQAASATVNALEHSSVLALPRSELSVKLQTNDRFAARFYRAIAVVLADRLYDRLTRHGYGILSYDKDQPLDAELEYEDELDLTTLEHVSLAGVRFDWLLRRKGISGG